MGDGRKQALRVQFDGKLKLEFRGANVTSDAGLLAFRELDEAFRITEKRSTQLSDCRWGKNTTIPAWGRLVLRRVPGKRLPQHSDQRKWVRFGVQTQALSSESHLGLEIRQGFGKMAASEAANGKSRLRRLNRYHGPLFVRSQSIWEMSVRGSHAHP